MSIRQNTPATKKAKAFGILIIAFLVGGVLALSILANCFDIVEANEFGLKQNVYTKAIIGNPVRGGGLQWVGLEFRYIKFPATWQTVNFLPGSGADDIPINTQTKDGLAITFDASFQYKLKLESLEQVYFDFGTEYHTQIIQVSRGALRNVAANFSATQFLQNRTEVSDTMLRGIVDALKLMNIEIEYFQLRAITLPGAFMDATEDVEVAKLLQQIAEYELEAAVIAAQQTIVEAETAANVSLINAYAAANVTITEAQAQALAMNLTKTIETATIADLMNATGMNSTELIAFFYVQALENLPPGTTLIMSDFVSLILGM